MESSLQLEGFLPQKHKTETMDMARRDQKCH